jgi:hypothetical protein
MKSKVALLLTDGEEERRARTSDDETPLAPGAACASRRPRRRDRRGRWRSGSCDAAAALTERSGRSRRGTPTRWRRLAPDRRASSAALGAAPGAAAAWLAAALLLFCGGRLLRATVWRVAP